MGTEAFKEIPGFSLFVFLYVLQVSVRVMTCTHIYHLPNASWPTTGGLFGKAAPFWINKILVLVLPDGLLARIRPSMSLISFLISKARVKLLVPFLQSQNGKRGKWSHSYLCCAPQRERPRCGSPLLRTGSSGLPLISWWPQKLNPRCLGSITPPPTPLPHVGDQARLCSLLQMWWRSRRSWRSVADRLTLVRTARCNHPPARPEVATADYLHNCGWLVDPGLCKQWEEAGDVKGDEHGSPREWRR